jgi:hypothetical protein
MSDPSDHDLNLPLYVIAVLEKHSGIPVGYGSRLEDDLSLDISTLRSVIEECSLHLLPGLPLSFMEVAFALQLETVEEFIEFFEERVLPPEPKSSTQTEFTFNFGKG